MTFQLVTDSTADLSLDWAAQKGIGILSLSVEVDGIVYDTVGDGAISSDFLLSKMAEGSKPKTSQIPPGVFDDYFREKAEEGKAILYLAFSSKLSGTFQSACIARDMVLADMPEANIVVIDTQAATCGEAYLVTRAQEAKEAGQSLEEVADLMKELAPRIRTYFLVDDLHHLVRGGRLSKNMAFLGELAHVKPVLCIGKDGQLTTLTKVRGRKKALKEIVSHVGEDIWHHDAMMTYIGDGDTAQTLKEALLRETSLTQVHMALLGPVIAAHTGPGTVVVAVAGEKER